MNSTLSSIINLDRYPLHCADFRAQCKDHLTTNGALVIDNFLLPETIESVRQDGADSAHLAHYTSSDHNVYLQPEDRNFSADHPRNRAVVSSKGCITTDQIPAASALHRLYDAPAFREFLCAVLQEQALYEYADPLSSINLHYASAGQELGWHFDNSSFAITLLIESPSGGGVFEYVKDVRDADAGEMNYDLAEKVLNAEVPCDILTIAPGSLVLFRGRNSMHRVTPTEGDKTRMLVVLAYNTQPGISLSESARMTFFGRLGET